MLATDRLWRLRLFWIRTVIVDRELSAEEIRAYLTQVATAALATLVLIHRYHVVTCLVEGAFLA